MRRIRKGPAPSRLVDLLNANPHATWDVVRKSRLRYDQIKSRLLADQESLCAYCEIRMVDGVGAGFDFRVEHFHPKRPHVSPPNYAAMWSNMLGCCHGGSQRSVTAQGRYTAPDLSCDAIKENRNLVGIILNPTTDIGVADFIFDFSVDGSVGVSNDCPASLLSVAQSTIDNLGLDSERLRRLRRAAIEAVLDAISTLSDDGFEFEEACKVAFPVDSPPEFYSCIRSILGPVAERRLESLNYYQ